MYVIKKEKKYYLIWSNILKLWFCYGKLIFFKYIIDILKVMYGK